MHPISDTDALFLLATTLASKRRPAELVEIMAGFEPLLEAVPGTSRLIDTIRRLTAHGLVQWRKLSEAVGATRVIDMPAYPASHNMGTNRMSAKAADGVVNKWGQAHDVKNLFISDGSQFTSSSAANPTLTIVALAIRQADHIAGEMSRGNL